MEKSRKINPRGREKFGSVSSFELNKSYEL